MLFTCGIPYIPSPSCIAHGADGFVVCVYGMTIYATVLIVNISGSRTVFTRSNLVTLRTIGRNRYTGIHVEIITGWNTGIRDRNRYNHKCRKNNCKDLFHNFSLSIIEYFVYFVKMRPCIFSLSPLDSPPFREISYPLFIGKNTSYFESAKPHHGSFFIRKTSQDDQTLQNLKKTRNLPRRSTSTGEANTFASNPIKHTVLESR